MIVETIKHQLFERKWVYYIVAALIYFGVYYCPMSDYFSPQGHKTLAVFAVAAFLWITSALPIAVVGILVLFLLPLSGAVPSALAYSYFGNSAIFFVLGAFILASPVMRSGLSTRMAVALISKFGRGPKSLLLSIFSLSAGSAFIMSEHAVAAMMLPIIGEIIAASRCTEKDRFPFVAYLAMGWGAIIGGTMTLLGGARAPLTIGILESVTHRTISFSQWTYYVYPAVLAMLLLAFLTVLFAARGCKLDVAATHRQLVAHHKKMGKMSQREVLTSLVLIVTVVLWVTVGSQFGLEAVALFGVLLAFVFKITNWQEIQEDVQWGILVMYGGAIALGAAMRDTGSAEGIVKAVLAVGIHSSIVVVLVMMALAFILTEAMSNAAAVAVLMPVGLVLGKQFGIAPEVIAVTIATAAGLTFLLPVSTPAMAIITNTPYLSPARAMSWGLIPKVVGFVLLSVIFLIYLPMIGLAV